MAAFAGFRPLPDSHVRYSNSSFGKLKVSGFFGLDTGLTRGCVNRTLPKTAPFPFDSRRFFRYTFRMNSVNEEKVYNVLQELDIDYTVHRHPAVYTADEARQYWSAIKGGHPKNLFLRDEKGKNHYLLIISYEKRADLKVLQTTLGSSRLSFASERRLFQHLGLSAGSVSVFGIINDKTNAVEVVIDKDLLEEEYINFHPNVNTATLTIRTEDFIRFLEAQGNRFRAVSV